MICFYGVVIALTSAMATTSAHAQPVFVGPLPYLSTADIPVGFYDGEASVDTLEDGTIDLGISATPGSVLSPGPLTDSVDADDGTIDGDGRDGHSWSIFPATSVVFTFSAPLPTAAALVVTDVGGSGDISFKAFGPGMIELGVAGPFSFADGNDQGETAEDRFFGVQGAGGILALEVLNTDPGIEIDHIKYGASGLDSFWDIEGGTHTSTFASGVSDSLADTSPDIASDGMGNWVAVWDVAPVFGTGEDILVARSTDAGQTWTPPAVIADSGALHDGARLATGGAGTWIVVWHSTDDLGGTIGTDWDILFSRSTDAGQMWTAPSALHSDFGSDGSARDIFPTVATDGHGTWVVAWETCAVSSCNINDDKDIMFSRSGNDGITWSKLAFLNSDAAGDAPKFDSRPSITTDGSGTWVAIWNPLMARSTNGGRNWSTVTAAPVGSPPNVITDGLGTWLVVGSIGGGDFDIEVSRSMDAGVSWTPAVKLNTNADSDSGDDTNPQLATDGLGNWLVTWISTEDLHGALGTDYDVLWASSMDAGTSWTAPRALDANAFSDSGIDLAPRLVTDTLGNWVMVWYSDDDRGGTIGADFDIFISTGVGPDRDGDGLSDGAEVNVYGTDSLVADTDGDGLSDGAEVNFFETNPLLEDTDGDLVCDGENQVGTCSLAGPDNCPFVSNLDQTNSDGAPAGDGCQCGDLVGQDGIDATDLQRARELVVGRTPGGPFDTNFCDVTGDGICGVDALYVIDRIANGKPATVVDKCPGYFLP